MPKKPSRKKTARKKVKLLPNVFTRFAALTLSVLLVVFVYALFTKTDRVRVLGESTVSEEYQKEYLAEKEEAKTVDTTQVDCVGPDGGHFTTSYTECKDFNKKWGNYDFKFTKLKSEEDMSKEKELKAEKLKKLEKEKGTTEKKKEITVTKTENKTFEVSEEKQKEEIPEEKIEKPKEKENPKREKTIIKSGEIEAETNLTVNVDENNKLSVMTETGSHDINILPSHAVQNLITLDILSSIESTGDVTTATAEASGNTIQLKEIDGKPAFEVSGISQKKVFGLFPVAFSKKVYVSVDDGKIVRTDEEFTNTLLQLVSF